VGDGQGYSGSQQPSGGYSGSGGTTGYGQSQNPPSPYGASVVLAGYGEKTPGQYWLEKALAEFITYKRQDPDNITDYDAKQYNLQVTSSYAKMYLTKPALFKWAGMAAFASHEVGRGMQQAWQLGFGTGTEMYNPALTWIGGLITGRGGDVGPMMGKLLFWALSGGNRLVWADIFWQHVAYRDAGLRAIQEAQKAGDIPQRVLDAWTTIDSGSRKKETDAVWDGNALLLMYEQQEILQRKIYEAAEVKDLWKAISPDVPSPIPGHTIKFTEYVPNGNIRVFADRWKWIFESMLPAWRNLESSDLDRTEKLVKALK